MRKFAISDIHGCAATFKKLLNEVDFNTADELYLLGDYVSRGPDSKGVFDHIFRLQELGHFVKCLRGNHEAMLLTALRDPVNAQRWAAGSLGKVTLQSFGVNSVYDIPEHYVDFIRDLDFYLEVEDGQIMKLSLSITFNLQHLLLQRLQLKMF